MKKIYFLCFLVFLISTNHLIFAQTNSTDFFRSKNTGNWNIAENWESSTNNTSWTTSSLVPNNTANTILIQNTHNITINTDVTLDQLVIQNGGTLTHSGGTLTIDNGTSDDIMIENGGTFDVKGFLATFLSGAVLRVKSNGRIISTSGNDALRYVGNNLSGPSSVTSNVVWENSSIYEHAQSQIFASTAVTFFPNVTTEIPIFRISQNTGAVGSNSFTTFNGIFEANGNITLQNSGIKTFRNGIRGTGTITQRDDSGKFTITADNAVLGISNLVLNSPNALEINNTNLSGKTNLTSNISISGTNAKIILTQGDLNLNGFNIDLGTTGNIQENLSNNHLVFDNTATTETNKGGYIRATNRNITNIGTEIGGLGIFLNWTTGANYSVNIDRYHYAAAGNGIKRIYQITGTPTGTSTMTINYASSELGIVSEPLNISRWQSGTGWENYSPTNADYSIKSLTYNNVTAFSHWTLSGQNNPLPVSLLSFNVMQTNDNQTNITWQTATEVNNNRFEIWKSTNGFDYVLIYTKDGQNNSTQIKNYNFIDNQFNESCYYQLKQIDNDGKINDLGIKFINKKQENINEIYPNPINEKIEIKNETSDLQMILFNQTGQKIWEGNNKNNLQNQFDSLPKGQYLIQFQNKNKIHYQKIIK
ncbi:MAG: T9SS C-terminal target domain-containing protein [Cytophagia bacterium]|nr:MAG: T9SS C-terminal target domain-containing protein [Cytophagia bacterium]